MLRLAPIALAGVLVYAPAAAGEWVEFSDGRSMWVEGFTTRDGMAVLDLEGGGQIMVPLSRISRRAGRPAAPATEDGSTHGAADPWRAVAGEYAELIASAALRHDLDPALLTAIAQVESAFDPYAVSEKNACGLLQLLPETAERFGVEDLFDPEQNIEGGARYLRWLITRYDGHTELALAAYNAGENAVDRHQGIPPYDETRTYVALVMKGAGLASAP